MYRYRQVDKRTFLDIIMQKTRSRDADSDTEDEYFDEDDELRLNNNNAIVGPGAAGGVAGSGAHGGGGGGAGGGGPVLGDARDVIEQNMAARNLGIAENKGQRGFGNTHRSREETRAIRKQGERIFERIQDMQVLKVTLTQLRNFLSSYAVWCVLFFWFVFVFEL